MTQAVIDYVILVKVSHSSQVAVRQPYLKERTYETHEEVKTITGGESELAKFIGRLMQDRKDEHRVAVKSILKVFFDNPARVVPLDLEFDSNLLEFKFVQKG